MAKICLRRILVAISGHADEPRDEHRAAGVRDPRYNGEAGARAIVSKLLAHWRFVQPEVSADCTVLRTMEWMTHC